MVDRSLPVRAGRIAIGFVLAILMGAACDGSDQPEPPEDVPPFSSYQEFFERCSHIETLETRLGSLSGELQSPGLTEERANALEAERDEIEQLRADAIRAYNANAAPFAEAEFEAAGLPNQLTQKGLTICEAA